MFDVTIMGYCDWTLLIARYVQLSASYHSVHAQMKAAPNFAIAPVA